MIIAITKAVLITIKEAQKETAYYYHSGSPLGIAQA